MVASSDWEIRQMDSVLWLPAACQEYSCSLKQKLNAEMLKAELSIFGKGHKSCQDFELP